MAFPAQKAICVLYLLTVLTSLSHGQTPRMLRGNELTFDGLQAFITAERITSLDELIRRMPESVRTSYNLVYRSQSIQPATPDQPRVILRSAASHSFLAFTGARDGSERSNSLEIIEQNPSTSETSAREIRFSSTPGRAPHFVRDPAICASCHGEPIHPNWQAYPFWPGVYGSDDDRLHAGTPEARNMLRYMERTARTAERYRWLKPALTAGQVHQLTNNVGVERNTRPNLQLNASISYMIATQLHHDITHSPQYSQCMDLLQYWALGCMSPPYTQALEAFFPSAEEALRRMLAWKIRINEALQRNMNDVVNPMMIEALRLPTTPGTPMATGQINSPRFFSLMLTEGTPFRSPNFDLEMARFEAGHIELNSYASSDSNLIRDTPAFLATVLDRCGLDLSHYSPHRSEGVFSFSDGGFGFWNSLRTLILTGQLGPVGSASPADEDYRSAGVVYGSHSAATECPALLASARTRRAHQAQTLSGNACSTNDSALPLGNNSFLREILRTLPSR